MRVDLRPQLHFLDDGLLLVAPRFAGLECALVLELAEVHELAHRRPRHRSNLDQIQIDIRGQLESTLERHDADLLTLRTDQTDLTSPDLFVHAWFDADGASSVDTSPGRLGRVLPMSVGPECPAGRGTPGKQKAPPAFSKERRLGPARPVIGARKEDAHPTGINPCQGDRTRPLM
ncbi:hypothetical protein GCM10010112_73740 [Actinoplanes lobatus]|uniref:Uncharacterized protein n=1 Tax=Actinoplanes lobatus TaxID=113568 RepID=A0ABQ4ARH9_9ACTN|nr:hypothetical protein GCM10010112_73740 [Actinoplanes lobatus]GIE43600.1 hypothetical protein Alo02nite_64980 [Actinoplanes lobatus]